MKIRKIAEIVKDILTLVPETRTDDNKLINKVYGNYGVDITLISFADVLNDKKLPKISSIQRARRKVQELYPDLKVEKVAEARINKETEFIEFSQDKSI